MLVLTGLSCCAPSGAEGQRRCRARARLPFVRVQVQTLTSEFQERMKTFDSAAFRDQIERDRDQCSDEAVGRLAALHGEDP